MPMQAIKEDLPRERLREHSEKYLSNRDLLAIILKTGTKDRSVLDLSKAILEDCKGDLHILKNKSLEELTAIKGIGPVKASELKACLELGARLSQSQQVKYGDVVSSKEAGAYLVKEMQDLLQEHLVLLCLNSKNQVIMKKTIFIGSANQSVAHPRDILREAVKQGAIRIIVAHNHPSGNPSPSQEDIRFTRRLLEAGEIVGVSLLDHLIIGANQFLSLKAEGYF